MFTQQMTHDGMRDGCSSTNGSGGCQKNVAAHDYYQHNRPGDKRRQKPPQNDAHCVIAVNVLAIVKIMTQ
jgi:hypothetical protein